MFDLKKQIKKWRSNLAQSQTLEKIDIDELESHMREEIESLKESKLSDEEAFLVAAKRLGSPKKLASEFAKTNWGSALRQRLSWMITGILIYMAAMYCAKIFTEGCVRLAINNKISDYKQLGLIGLGVQISALIIILLSGYFIYKYLLKMTGFKRIINQITVRSTLLIFILVVIICRMSIHIPVPGFKAIDIQMQIDQALRYTQLLWAVLVPSVLVILLIGLKSSKIADN